MLKLSAHRHLSFQGSTGADSAYRVHKWSHKSSVTHASLPISIAIARFPIVYDNPESTQGKKNLMPFGILIVFFFFCIECDG